MVPDDYREFFVTAATVAGALIGLLFVVVSVRPEAAARTAHITTRLRAIAALTAFLNTLFLSLLALRPRGGFGEASIVLGAIGLVSILTLLALLAVQGRDRPRALARGVLLLLGQGFLFALQVWSGWNIKTRPADFGQVDNLSIVVIVLFALGIARAWEFVGADDPSLLTALRTVAGARVSGPDPEAPPANRSQVASGDGEDTSVPLLDNGTTPPEPPQPRL